MKKVLIPTDFSPHSKAGLRFALQWSTMEKLGLVFVHVLHILRPPQWTDSYFLKYTQQEKKKYSEKLEKFVTSVCKDMSVKPGKYSSIIIEGFSADLAIMEYCRHHNDIDFICISTRGAGRFQRIFGTNTGNLITKSKVPVIAIPENYKVKPFKQLLFAADFHHYRQELKRVVSFARPLKTSVEILHFTWPDEVLPDKELIEAVIKKEFKFPLKLHFERTDARYSLVQNLQKQILALKPSVVIMFTIRPEHYSKRFFYQARRRNYLFN